MVSIERRVKHPMLKKPILKSKKYKAHDEKNMAITGNKVVIRECRAISKDKKFRLVEIVSK